MSNRYTERFAKIVETVKSDTIKEHAHLDHPKSFTRKRKMPLEDIIFCTLSKKGLTTAIEIHKYFIQKGAASMSISKHGYLQQRKKLNYEAFSFLNKEYLQGFYSTEEPVLWNNHLVFAVDGSKAEIPNSDENRAPFGECGNQHDKGEVRALVSCMFDIFNHFFLDLQIDSIKASESELAKQNINTVNEMLKDTPFIVVFDRGYPSIEFVHFLEKNNIKYLFRLSSNDYIKERQLMIKEDEAVRLAHTPARLAKIKKNHPAVVEELKIKEYTSTRIISSVLPSGSEIALMTNLPLEISRTEIENLYFKRWEIEKKYHTLKNKMKFESITGKATLYVYQDFWAQIVVYNMIQDVLHASNEKITEESKKQEYKYPRGKRLIKLQESIEKYVVPVRKLKSHDRKHNLSNKYKNNQKNSF